MESSKNQAIELGNKLLKAAKANDVREIQAINRQIDTFARSLSKAQKGTPEVKKLSQIHSAVIQRLSGELKNIESKIDELSGNKDGLRAYEETGAFS